MSNELIAIALDLLGWEQDGSGLTFINVGGDGSRRTFRSWNDAAKFATRLTKKNLARK